MIKTRVKNPPPLTFYLQLRTRLLFYHAQFPALSQPSCMNVAYYMRGLLGGFMSLLSACRVFYVLYSMLDTRHLGL